MHALRRWVSADHKVDGHDSRAALERPLAEEPPSTVEWIIAPGADGVTRVTTIHRDLALSPLRGSPGETALPRDSEEGDQIIDVLARHL